MGVNSEDDMGYSYSSIYDPGLASSEPSATAAAQLGGFGVSRVGTGNAPGVGDTVTIYGTFTVTDTSVHAGVDITVDLPFEAGAAPMSHSLTTGLANASIDITTSTTLTLTVDTINGVGGGVLEWKYQTANAVDP